MRKSADREVGGEVYDGKEEGTWTSPKIIPAQFVTIRVHLLNDGVPLLLRHIRARDREEGFGQVGHGLFVPLHDCDDAPGRRMKR